MESGLVSTLLGRWPRCGEADLLELDVITCSLDEENLGGQLFLKYGGFKALPVTDVARIEKVIQFARSSNG